MAAAAGRGFLLPVWWQITQFCFRESWCLRWWKRTGPRSASNVMTSGPVLILAGLVKRQQLKNRHRIIKPVSSFVIIEL